MFLGASTKALVAKQLRRRITSSLVAELTLIEFYLVHNQGLGEHLCPKADLNVFDVTQGLY